MSNWEIYVRESYELVKRAESQLTVNLEHNIEAYIVHLFAHYLDKPNINTEPLGVKLLASVSLPTTQRKHVLKEIGDECLLVNSMEWGRRRWPSSNYYSDLGQNAYLTRAFMVQPSEDLFDDLAWQFETATKVLRTCRPQ